MYLWQGLKNISPFTLPTLEDIAIKSISLSKYYAQKTSSGHADDGDESGEELNDADGRGHGVILTEEGKVYTFGDNMYGQLGLGDCIKRGQEPVIVEELSSK